jgi:PAS domain S-box-containing protein
MSVKGDITKHKRWEDKLHLLAAVVHDSNDAITVKDFEGNIRVWNKAAERIYGYSKSEALKMNFRQLVPEEKRAEALDMVKRLRKGEDIHSFETHRITKDGRILDIWLTVTTLKSDSGRPIAITTTERDITERKLLEKEMLEIPMREREQIGREMHDSLGQILTGIAIKSKGLEIKLKRRSLEESTDATEICGLANELIAQTRRLAKLLHPVDLKVDGLASALRVLASNTERLLKVSCEVKCKSVPHIQDSVTASHLYRIAQEAITNAAKHGKAKKVRIEFAADETKSVLRIRNDGRSFPGVTTRKTGLGLKIMDYRARSIGASLDVRKGTNGGAIVTCLLPHKNNNSGTRSGNDQQGAAKQDSIEQKKSFNSRRPSSRPQRPYITHQGKIGHCQRR